MDASPSNNQQRIRVGGIKLSPELSQFTCSMLKGDSRWLTPALRKIGERQINISYFTQSFTNEIITATICVAKENTAAVQSILSSMTDDQGSIKHIPSVGAITIFPHRNSLKLITGVTRLFAENSLPILGFCTSVSAFSIVTEYSNLVAATSSLEEILELPDNHSPFTQEFSIHQIGTE